MKTILRNLLLLAMAWAVAIGAFGSDSRNLKGKDANAEPNPASGRHRFPLSDYGDLPLIEKSTHIEWSATGERLCLWWARDRISRCCPGEWIVLNRDGGVISSWTNCVVKPQDALVEFPSLSVWFRWREYLTNAAACAVDEKDWNLFRASPPRDVDGSISVSTRIEMLQLRPVHRVVWTKDFVRMQRVDQMGIVSTGTRKSLVVMAQGQEGKLLDPATGAAISLSYGHIESREEALKRREKFRLEYRPEDAFIFWGRLVALDQNLGRVAVASAFEDRRVRVVSLAAPFPVLFEAHADENPCPLQGGNWMAWKVDFVASGKYLVVESRFGRRQFGIERCPTEIYETQGWRKVWQVEDLKTHSVTVSPDGMTMALIRDNVLEISPFLPMKGVKKE